MMGILVLHTTNLEMKQPSETKHIRRDSLLWATVFGFWRPETNHRPTRESQPDIHDSDGLRRGTSADEHIRQPPDNPPVMQTSPYFQVANIRC